MDDSDTIQESIPLKSADGEMVGEVQITHAGIVKLATLHEGHRSLIASLGNGDADFQLHDATGRLVLTFRLDRAGTDIVVRGETGESAMTVHMDRKGGTVTMRDPRGGTPIESTVKWGA